MKKTMSNYVGLLPQMRNMFLIVMFFAFGMIACQPTDSKNESQENEINDNDADSGSIANVDLSGLVKSVNVNGKAVVEFFYDKNKRLKSEIIHNGSDVMEAEYKYSDNKLALQTETYKGSIVSQYSFDYDKSGQLIKVSLVGADSFWKISYNDKNKINLIVQYISGGEAIKYKFTYNGNNIEEAIKFKRFGSVWEQERRMEFEYDSKHNYMYDLNLHFSEILDEFASMVCPNNFTRIKKYDQNNMLTDDNSYQMEYNKLGYPIKIIEDNKISYNVLYY